MTSYELNICAPFILETYIRTDGRVATRATKYLDKEILVVDEGYLNANNTVKRMANELHKRGWILERGKGIYSPPDMSTLA